MYSKLKNVQVIISLLKQNGIKNLVLSPGTRDVPLVHSVEQDEYFNCYSMVDERSAAYFALGLSLQLDEPVCLSCTSSTATCNYLPAVQEAYKKHAQIVLLTADRNNYLLKQGEDQLIVQDKMYGQYVNAAVNLPIVKDNQDLLYCIRKTNEALLELNHFKKGPVQINFQVQVIDLCRQKVLPTYRKVTRIKQDDKLGVWNAKKLELGKFKRIMIVYGQSYYSEDYRKNVNAALNKFGKKYNCVVSYEGTSNVICDNAVKTSLITEAMTESEFENFVPDLVITLGNHFFSFLKYKLRNRGEKIEHWRVCEDGSYLDNFDALTTIFQCDEVSFLELMSDGVEDCNINEYADLWRARVNKVVFPDLMFSNFSAVRDICRVMPENSLVHLTILNSLRLFNFQDISSFRSFCNLGADGIDGGMSTFLGQASIEDKLAFIITGDLSFFYDLDSSFLKHNNNIRVFMINNYAGSEFHNNFGLEKIPSLNDFIAAGHKSKAEYFVESTDYMYLHASNQEELENALKIFVEPSEKAILLEVFTDANTDSQILKRFYAMNAVLSPKEKVVKITKEYGKRVLKLLHLR